MPSDLHERARAWLGDCPVFTPLGERGWDSGARDLIRALLAENERLEHDYASRGELLSYAEAEVARLRALLDRPVLEKIPNWDDVQRDPHAPVETTTIRAICEENERLRAVIGDYLNADQKWSASALRELAEPGAGRPERLGDPEE